MRERVYMLCVFIPLSDVAAFAGMASRVAGETKLLTFQALGAKPIAQLMRGSTYARQRVIIRQQ